MLKFVRNFFSSVTWAKVNWQFTTADARIKLRRLYPSIE